MATGWQIIGPEKIIHVGKEGLTIIEARIGIYREQKLGNVIISFANLVESQKMSWRNLLMSIISFLSANFIIFLVQIAIIFKQMTSPT